MARDDVSAFEAMSTAELMRLRSALNITLALAIPGSPVAVPAERQLRSIALTLAAREHEGSPPSGG